MEKETVFIDRETLTEEELRRELEDETEDAGEDERV